AAPAGTAIWPFRPTAVNWSFWTTKAESSMGAPPSPVMSTAPSKTDALPGAVWLPTGAEQAAAAANRNATMKKCVDVLVIIVLAPLPSSTAHATPVSSQSDELHIC